MRVITGDIKEINNEPSNDINLRFNGTIFTGNVRERIKILVEKNQMALALATAKIHGIMDYYNDLAKANPDLVDKV